MNHLLEFEATYLSYSYDKNKIYHNEDVSNMILRAENLLKEIKYDDTVIKDFYPGGDDSYKTYINYKNDKSRKNIKKFRYTFGIGRYFNPEERIKDIINLYKIFRLDVSSMSRYDILCLIVNSYCGRIMINDCIRDYVDIIIQNFEKDEDELLNITEEIIIYWHLRDNRIKEIESQNYEYEEKEKKICEMLDEITKTHLKKTIRYMNKNRISRQKSARK